MDGSNLFHVMLLATVAMPLLLGAFVWFESETKKRLRRQGEERLGPGWVWTSSGFEGRVEGHVATVHPSGNGAHWVRVEGLPELDFELPGPQKRGRPTGDRGLDRQVAIQSTSLPRMTAEERTKLREIVGELPSAQLGGGRLLVQVWDARDGQALVDALPHVERLAALAVELGTTERPSLASLVRSDPSPGVRRLALEEHLSAEVRDRDLLEHAGRDEDPMVQSLALVTLDRVPAADVLEGLSSADARRLVEAVASAEVARGLVGAWWRGADHWNQVRVLVSDWAGDAMGQHLWTCVQRSDLTEGKAAAMLALMGRHVPTDALPWAVDLLDRIGDDAARQVLEAVAASGTVALVPALREAAERASALSGLRSRVEQTVDVLQARVAGGGGGLALADQRGGGLAVAEEREPEPESESEQRLARRRAATRRATE